MIIISKYKLENKTSKAIFKVRSYEDKNCPLCGGRLNVIGSRLRHLTTEPGDPIVLSIRKLSCDKCGKIHSELPDAIFPYHRLCSSTIKSIVSGDKNAAVCDEASYRRIRLWWTIFSKRSGVLSVEDANRKINAGVITWVDFRKCFPSYNDSKNKFLTHKEEEK